MIRGTFVFIIDKDKFITSEIFDGHYEPLFNENRDLVKGLYDFNDYLITLKTELNDKRDELTKWSTLEKIEFSLDSIKRVNEVYFKEAGVRDIKCTFINKLNGDSLLDFSGDYITKWNSVDYVYAINLSDDKVSLVSANKKIETLNSFDLGYLHYGYFVDVLNDKKIVEVESFKKKE